MNYYVKTIALLFIAFILVAVGCTKSELATEQVQTEVKPGDNNSQNDNLGDARRPWLAFISVEILFGHKTSHWDSSCMCWGPPSPCQSHGLCEININGSQGGSGTGEIAVNQSELSIIIPKANFDQQDLDEQFSGRVFYHPEDLEFDRAMLTKLANEGFTGDLQVIEAGHYNYFDLGDEFEIVILKD